MSKFFLAAVLLLASGFATFAAETSLSMSSDPGEYIGGGQEYFYAATDGNFAATRNYAQGVSVSFNTPTYSHWWYMDFAAPNGAPLSVGVYPGATRFPFEDPSEPGLSVYGDGRACNTLTGSFEVKEIVYGAGDEIVSFRATFEQHCEGGLSALRGEIRFNASLPVEIAAPRDLSTLVGEELSFDVTAVASDGGRVTITATGLPAGATFSDRGDSTGQFLWTPGPTQFGLYSVTFAGQDSQGHVEQVTTAIAVGGIIHVPSDQPTIQAAIDLATPGSQVLVSPGTYLENINFRGKAITVESIGGPDVTVIDGHSAGTVVTFASGEGRDSVLRGFTLRNGGPNFNPPNYGDGGGIYVGSSSPTIAGNVITHNTACAGCGISVNFGAPRIEDNAVIGNFQSGCSGGIGGGGISLGGAAQAEILNNVIADNTTSSDGGGISMFAAGTPTIQGNVIRGNAGSQGGGISLVNFSDAEIVGNLIVANRASQGGGIWWLVPSGTRGPRVVNNTIVDNDSEFGSGILADGFDVQSEIVNNIIVAKEGQTALHCGDFNDLNPPVMRFNDVFSPTGSDYGGTCSNQTGNNGNISADPMFQCPPSGDYRLMSSSQAIDAGDDSIPGLPATDLVGGPRILDGDGDNTAAIDLGAFEFDPSAPAGVCIYALCPGDVHAVAPPGQTSAIVEFTAPIAPSGATVVCVPPSGADFPGGATTVTCTATDLAGNSAACSFQVTVTIPPSNDDFDYAKTIRAIPYTDTLDTTEATTASDDPGCIAGGGTVWYAFTPTQDTIIDASTSGSTYFAPLSAYSGSRGSLQSLACGYDRVTLTALAGQTVYFMVGSDFGSGGTLVFTVTGRPPLAIDVAINPVGVVTPATGRATVYGTVTCTRPVPVTISGELRRRLGRAIISGTFSLQVACEGLASWSADVISQNGLFTGGNATAAAYAVAYDFQTGEQASAQDNRAIHLNAARRQRQRGGRTVEPR
jgi:parallel beta-helix repeat protein